MKNIFSCKRCGFCCHGETTVSLDAKDQANMLSFLQISREEALQKYWRLTGSEVQMKTVDGHCIFFNNGCSVHGGRPWRCKEWPLVRGILEDHINLETIKSSCPGIQGKASYSDVCKCIKEGGCLSNSDKHNGAGK